MPREVVFPKMVWEKQPGEGENMKQENKPFMSRRLGRFQVSMWSFTRLRKARNDFDAEREYEVVRACVQYSRYNRRSCEFERQQIWCDPMELRSLAALLEGPDDEEKADPADQAALSCVQSKAA
jgi:hypothetical protein